MNKGAKIAAGAVGVGLLAFGIYKGTDLLQKSDAAKKLSLDLDDVSLESATKQSVKIKVKFSVKNPSTKDLGFENLYVKVSIPNSEGTLKKVADTVPDPTGTKIPAGQTVQSSRIAEVKYLDILLISPDVAIYLGGRAKGAKATRKAKIEWTYTSEGFNLSDKKEILL